MKAASATMDHDVGDVADDGHDHVGTSKQDIAEVLVRYATGIDRRDWDLFRSCFTADCVAEYEDIGTWESADAITDFMVTRPRRHGPHDAPHLEHGHRRG